MLAAMTACDSKVESTVDENLQAKAEAVSKCVPPQVEKLVELLDFSDRWRLNDVDNPPDPSGLAWSYDGTEITYTFTLGSVISGKIRFYSPTGVQQNGLTLSSVSLSQAIDDAATELRDNFPSGSPFMVGEWALSGANVSSAGGTSSPCAFTGIIGGSLNQNELEELRTTEGFAAVAGGPPPVQDCSITTTGAQTCVFTFRLPELFTDEEPGQEYPRGTLTLSLENQTSGVTLSGSLVFDTTVIAKLTIDGITGVFDVNLETFSVVHNP